MVIYLAQGIEGLEISANNGCVFKIFERSKEIP